MFTITFCNTDKLFYAYDQNNIVRVKASTREAIAKALKSL